MYYFLIKITKNMPERTVHHSFVSPCSSHVFCDFSHPCGCTVLKDLPRWMGHPASWWLRCLGFGIAFTCLSLSGPPAGRLLMDGVRSRLDRHHNSGCASVDVNLLRCLLFTAWSLITRAANTGVWATTWATVLTRRLAIRYKDERWTMQSVVNA